MFNIRNVRRTQKYHACKITFVTTLRLEISLFPRNGYVLHLRPSNTRYREAVYRTMYQKIR